MGWKQESAHVAVPLLQRSAVLLQCHCKPRENTSYCSCTNIKQRMCSCESNSHCLLFVFSRAVLIAFFCTDEKKAFSKRCTFKIWMYQRNRKNAVCRRYYCLLHIYAATVIYFLTTGAEEFEKGTGKTAMGFVLNSPLERIPVSYCCASMEALWARLHCSVFWGKLVIRLLAFIMSLVLDAPTRSVMTWVWAGCDRMIRWL